MSHLRALHILEDDEQNPTFRFISKRTFKPFRYDTFSKYSEPDQCTRIKTLG